MTENAPLRRIPIEAESSNEAVLAARNTR